MSLQKPTNLPNALKAPIVVTVSQHAGTSYTFALGDDWVQFTAGGAVTATVPPYATVPFVIGTTITVEQNGGGQVLISAGAGVTLHSSGALLHTAAQYAIVGLTKTALNTWNVYGDRA